MKKKREKPIARPRGPRRIVLIVAQRVLVAALILLQLLLWIFVPLSSAVTYQWINGIFRVIGVFAVLFVISEPTPAAYRLLWTVLLLLVPVVGVTLLVLFRARGVSASHYRYVRRKNHYPPVRLPDEPYNAGDFTRCISYLASHGFRAESAVGSIYFPLGEYKFKRLIEELSRAERYVFMEYFIIDDGVLWERVLDVLRSRAEKGVEVRILMDDIGCFMRRPRGYAETLRKMGFKVRIFNRFTPFVTATQNYRDHRKIVVVDGRVAFTGGANLADEYINKRRRFGHWKDTAVMVSGAAAQSFSVFFLRMWETVTRTSEDMTPYLLEGARTPIGDGGVAVPYVDSPVRNDDAVTKNLYLNMISSAKRSLWITTPYLIPDESLTDALCLAARSGVDVRIITPSTPDKKLVNVTTKTYYRPLQDAGVRIYEYTPGFIHSKVLLADGVAASVGSANMDYRSLYLSFECGVFLHGADTVLDIARDFEETFAVSEEMPLREEKAGIIGKVFRRVLRLFSPLM